MIKCCRIANQVGMSYALEKVLSFKRYLLSLKEKVLSFKRRRIASQVGSATR